MIFKIALTLMLVGLGIGVVWVQDGNKYLGWLASAFAFGGLLLIIWGVK